MTITVKIAATTGTVSGPIELLGGSNGVLLEVLEPRLLRSLHQ